MLNDIKTMLLIITYASLFYGSISYIAIQFLFY